MSALGRCHCICIGVQCCVCIGTQSVVHVEQVPCAAMGLLYSMEQTLLDRRVWSGALDMLPAPAFLSLMLVLVPLQPLMHTKVSTPADCLMKRDGLMSEAHLHVVSYDYMN